MILRLGQVWAAVAVIVAAAPHPALPASVSAQDAMRGPDLPATRRERGESRTAIASWYLLSGSQMADGEIMHAGDRSIANRDMPFGTRCRFTWNHRSARGVVRDRGPAASTGRQFDLERSIAVTLGFTNAGTASVHYQCRRR